MTAPLTPAAQAVLDALKMEGLTGPERFWARAHAVAALYAAAHHLTHDRRQLAAIATELENHR